MTVMQWTDKDIDKLLVRERDIKYQAVIILNNEIVYIVYVILYIVYILGNNDVNGLNNQPQ